MIAYKTTLVDNKPHPKGAAILFTRKYAFTSDANKQRYIILVEFYSIEICAIKFYPKCLELSKRKYETITNFGDIWRIVFTVLGVAREILESDSRLSFAFYGVRTIELEGSIERVEPLTETQRFLFYSDRVSKYIKEETFEHIRYPEISCYLLINRCHADLSAKENEFKELFAKVYPGLVNPEQNEDPIYYPSEGG